MPLPHKSIGMAGMAIMALSLSACATEDYVDKHIAVVNDRVTQLEGRVGQVEAAAQQANAAAQAAGASAQQANQRIDQLVLTARIEAKSGLHLEVAGRSAKQFSVGPDAADARCRSRGQRNCEARRIAVDDDVRLSLRFGLRFAAFLKLGRPDNGARYAHPSVDARDLRSVARRLDAEVAKARPTPRRSEYLLIDRLTDQAADRASDRPAEKRPDGTECQRCHRSGRPSRPPAERPEHRPRGRARRLDHPAEPRIRMNKPCAGANPKMKLVG